MAAGEKEMNALHKALAEAYAKGLKEPEDKKVLSFPSKAKEA